MSGAATASRVCDFSSAETPIVILALDGVPLSAVEEARSRGAFAEWPATRALISTFPSMTNVSFAAILGPLGVEPIAGYEIPHFDHDRGKMVGKSPFGARKRAYAWRSVVDKKLIGIWGHAVGYAAPRHKALAELAQVEGKILRSTRQVLVVYIAATDSLTHFSGYDGTVGFLLELDRRIGAVQSTYRRETGRCLRLILLSDHGNTEKKVRRVTGLRSLVRKAGFRIRSRLLGLDDAVMPTFGLCNYGAIYVEGSRARHAAESIAEHPQVDLAAFVSGDRRIDVLTRTSSAVLSWRTSEHEDSFSYQPNEGDPLGLAEVVSRLGARGAIDEDGYARFTDWLDESYDTPFPNAPARIVDALTGTFVRNSASVLFSITPGYAWGRRAGYIGAGLKGGRLEGTHGGLDSVSSMGFFLVNDPASDPGRAVSSTDALSFLAKQERTYAASPQ
jgi:hypothetical protein